LCTAVSTLLALTLPRAEIRAGLQMWCSPQRRQCRSPLRGLCTYRWNQIYIVLGETTSCSSHLLSMYLLLCVAPLPLSSPHSEYPQQCKISEKAVEDVIHIVCVPGEASHGINLQQPKLKKAWKTFVAPIEPRTSTSADGTEAIQKQVCSLAGYPHCSAPLQAS
jgi:hypothetical protein